MNPDPQVIRQILKSNGLSSESPDAQIVDLLMKANYSEAEALQGIKAMREPLPAPQVVQTPSILPPGVPHQVRAGNYAVSATSSSNAIFVAIALALILLLGGIAYAKISTDGTEGLLTSIASALK